MRDAAAATAQGRRHHGGTSQAGGRGGQRGEGKVGVVGEGTPAELNPGERKASAAMSAEGVAGGVSEGEGEGEGGWAVARAMGKRGGVAEPDSGEVIFFSCNAHRSVFLFCGKYLFRNRYSCCFTKQRTRIILGTVSSSRRCVLGNMMRLAYPAHRRDRGHGE